MNTEDQVDYTIPEWCGDAKFSVSLYHKLQRQGLGPRVVRVGVRERTSPSRRGWLIGEIKGPSASNGFQKMKRGRDRPKSILLIGHRVTLINEAARRLGLQSYQDSEPTRYYAVCGNSLAFRCLEFTYDVVIIDESEQVFRHLTSDIVNDIPGGQARCFAEMKHHIAEAKSVIVLDADMSLITTQVLKILRRTDWDHQRRIIYNKPLPVEGHREVLIFKTEGQLIQDLMQSLRAGQRCFVASNSKKRVQDLSVMIREEFGETRRRLVITSEESQTPKIRDFLSDVRNQILEYDVLIVSPAMGIGVDITFENDACRIDCVYGFFEPFINTHTDIDQQLARVRNPGSVKVWFKPGRFDFETSIDTIRDDLARAGVAAKAVEWLGNGELKYDKNDPLREIWTHVTCARRSSMKNIERLFIGLREANGWSVVKAKHDEASAQSGKAALKDAEQIRNAEHVERVMKASLIDRQGFLRQTAQKQGTLDPLGASRPGEVRA